AVMVREISSEDEFRALLESAGAKPVLVDFYANWCGPCKAMAPKVNDLASRNPDVVFAKVNVDKVEAVSSAYGVTSLPTFALFLRGQRIESLVGADPDKLEALVKKYAKSAESVDKFGHMDMLSLISMAETECLNESDAHPLKSIMSAPGAGDSSAYLESDADEQLVIFITFSQSVKIHSLRLVAPYENAPKTVKLFINQPSPIDFSAAESAEGVQAFQLTSADVQPDAEPLQLKFVKFQNVRTLTVFVQDNQADSEVTRLSRLIPIGCPVATTNMTDFKRVAGKAGEGHE
ncbi:hypothetical protein BOX15_Mlig030178g2, partial [Macrostomum lignano]